MSGGLPGLIEAHRELMHVAGNIARRGDVSSCRRAYSAIDRVSDSCGRCWVSGRIRELQGFSRNCSDVLRRITLLAVRQETTGDCEWVLIVA